MDKAKRAALEKAGYRVGDAADFLGLTDAEREIVELRVTLALAVRRLRTSAGLTQKQFAKQINSSQSRVAKLESGASGVSLDLLFRGLFELGGGLSDVVPLQKGKHLATRKASKQTAVKKRSNRPASA